VGCCWPQADHLKFVADNYPAVARANTAGTSMFKALQQACALLDDEALMPDDDIVAFLAAAKWCNADVSRGVGVPGFVAQLKLSGSRLSADVLDNNRHDLGHRGPPRSVELRPLHD